VHEVPERPGTERAKDEHSPGAAKGARLRRVTAVEVPCGAGALDDGTKEGAAEFRRLGDPDLRARGIDVRWRRSPNELGPAHLLPLEAVSRAARWTAGETRALTRSGDSFVVIGGDHSCAIGTWSGVADALRPSGPLGLIWIDAHMDMHVPQTTHSGAINGMPVASLLGYGPRELTSIAETGPALRAQSLCLIGARSFEAEEVEFSRRHGVRVIGMEEVHQRGIEAVWAEARTIATNGTAAFGVSLDLDVFDPADAPAVGTPEPGGLSASAFLQVWGKLIRDPKRIGLEIVEYNPLRDRGGRTLRLMTDLIAATM
jgi:arginase